MKKNRMMRLASVLLVAVLMTTCTISGTFAKYVTTNSGADIARVAAWGVQIESVIELFDTSYVTHDTTLSPEEQSRIGTHSVISGYGGKVVAPGTNGTVANFNITGKPEVAVKVTYAVDEIKIDNWKVDDVYYCPIIVNVCGTYLDGKDYTNAGDFIAAIKGAVAGYTKAYAANTNLADYDGEGLTISWEWPFANDAGTKYNQNDAKDTKLGNWILSGAPAPSIEITVSCTVTQID